MLYIRAPPFCAYSSPLTLSQIGEETPYRVVVSTIADFMVCTRVCYAHRSPCIVRLAHLTHCCTHKQDLSATEDAPAVETDASVTAPPETPVPSTPVLQRSWSLELGNHNIDKVRNMSASYHRCWDLGTAHACEQHAHAQTSHRKKLTRLPSDHGHEVPEQSVRTPRP